MLINKFLLAAVIAATSSVSFSQETTSIQSLAEAQRMALEAKEREIRLKASPPIVVAPPPKKREKAPPPPKTHLLHAIYTNGNGELIAEVVNGGVLSQYRDNDAILGGTIEIDTESTAKIRDMRNPECTKSTKKCNTRIHVNLSIGDVF